MIQMEIILTIHNEQFDVETARDLFVVNRCIDFTTIGRGSDGATLSCVSVLKEQGRPPKEVVAKVLFRVAESLVGSLGLDVWLCACAHGDDSRLVRYRGVSGLLGLSAVSRRQMQVQEILKDDSGGLRLYGVFKWSVDEIEMASSYVMPASRSFLVLYPRHGTPDLAAMIHAGWRRGLSVPTELRDIGVVVSRRGGVLLRTFGQFDDRVAGVDCLMAPKLFAQIIDSVDNRIVDSLRRGVRFT